MVTIPRYGARLLPGGQLDARVDDLGGETLERMAQIVRSASGVAAGMKGLNDIRLANQAARAEREAKAADVAFRQGAREALEAMERGGPGREAAAASLEQAAAAVRTARERAGQGLTGEALDRFEALSAPREAGLLTEAAARTRRQEQEAAAALSRVRQAMGVEDFLRLAEVDEDQARIALASAGGELAERLAAEGADAAASTAARREFVSRVQAERVGRRIDEDPDAGEALLQRGGDLLTEDMRGALGRRLAAERLRREAGEAARTLLEARIAARGEDAAADDLDGLTADAEALAEGGGQGSDLLRREAYRAAITGAWRTARQARETREGAAWAGAVAAMTELAGQGGGAAAWTDLPGTVWSALSPRQQAALKARMATPHADSEPAATAFLNRLAASDAAGFRELDLGELYGALTPRDHAGWRAMQDLARAGGVEWRQARADIARLTRAIDAGAPGADEAARGRLHEMLADAEALNGGPLGHDALAAICQQATSELERALAPRATPVPPIKLGPALLEPGRKTDPFDPFDGPSVVDLVVPPPPPPKPVRPPPGPAKAPHPEALTFDFDARVTDVAARFENPSGDPGLVSKGGKEGDLGLDSYGLYQFSAKWKVPEDFLERDGRRYRSRFLRDGKLIPSTDPEFARIWKEVSDEDPHLMATLQRNYMLRKLDRYAVSLENRRGIKLRRLPIVVQQVIFSTLVQHGDVGGSGIIDTALRRSGYLDKVKEGDPNANQDFVAGVYEERFSERSDGTLRYFVRSPNLRKGLRARGIEEKASTLEALAREEQGGGS